MQVTVKYRMQFVVLDGISKNARFSDILSLLEARLCSKIPVNARLLVNHRYFRMNDTIEKVLPMSA